MKKPELIEAVANESGVNVVDVKRVIEAFFSVLTSAILKRDKVTLVGFGSFIVRERAARTARNPRTGETVQVAAKKTLRFQPGRFLRESLQK